MRSLSPGLAVVALVFGVIASCGGKTLVGGPGDDSTGGIEGGVSTGTFTTGTPATTGTLTTATTGTFTTATTVTTGTFTTATTGTFTTGTIPTTGTFTSGDFGTATGITTAVTTGTNCVEVDPSTYDRSCMTDQDCISITAGELCQETCFCGGTAISRSGQARYEAAIASIVAEPCGCSYDGPVLCLQNQCTQCIPNLNPPLLGCPGGPDSGVSPDSGLVAEAGAPCVDIDLSTYDQSCAHDSDCIEVTSGQICAGACQLLGGSAVNVSEQARYNAAVAFVTPDADGGACVYPPPPMPFCAAGQCASCSTGLIADGGCPVPDPK
jgi:hypothetical protein